MAQQTFSDLEYSNRKRKTNREKFPDIMEEIIPWDEWVEFVVPYYPSGKRGRPTKGIEKMLRMYLLQIWFNLSDEGVEDAIYDSYAFRKFMGINFNEEQVPDATTLLKFRHLIEKNHLGEQMFRAINYVLEQNGAMMKGGTIVDATILNAPSSTKNQEKSRDYQEPVWFHQSPVPRYFQKFEQIEHAVCLCKFVDVCRGKTTFRTFRGIIIPFWG